MKSIRWAAVLAVGTLMGCGGSDSVGPGNGGGAAFTATVSGDVQTSIKGDARFGEATDPNSGDIFAVEMSENDSAGGGVIQLIHIGSGVPGTGTYGLADAVNGNPGDGDWVAVAYDSDNGQLTASFAATSGSVRVTRADNGAYQGTFDFIATGAATADPGTVLTIAVNGKFTARKVTGIALRGAPSLRSR